MPHNAKERKLILKIDYHQFCPKPRSDVSFSRDLRKNANSLLQPQFRVILSPESVYTSLEKPSATEISCLL